MNALSAGPHSEIAEPCGFAPSPSDGQRGDQTRGQSHRAFLLVDGSFHVENTHGLESGHRAQRPAVVHPDASRAACQRGTADALPASGEDKRQGGWNRCPLGAPGLGALCWWAASRVTGREVPDRDDRAGPTVSGRRDALLVEGPGANTKPQGRERVDSLLSPLGNLCFNAMPTQHIHQRGEIGDGAAGWAGTNWRMR